MDIISNYKDLSLEKYMQLREIISQEYEEEVDFQVKVISVLADIDEDAVLHLPIDTFMDCCRKSRFLDSEPDGVRRRPAKEYTLGSFTLVPVTDLRKVTTGQYIDFQSFLKGGEDKLVELLSCLLVPKGKEYCDGYDIIEVQKAIAVHLSVTEASALFAFFLRSLTASTRATLNYLKRRAAKVKDQKARKAMTEAVDKALAMYSGSGGDGRRM